MCDRKPFPAPPSQHWQRQENNEKRHPNEDHGVPQEQVLPAKIPPLGKVDPYRDSEQEPEHAGEIGQLFPVQVVSGVELEHERVVDFVGRPHATADAEAGEQVQHQKVAGVDLQEKRGLFAELFVVVGLQLLDAVPDTFDGKYQSDADQEPVDERALRFVSVWFRDLSQFSRREFVVAAFKVPCVEILGSVDVILDEVAVHKMRWGDG